MLSTFIKTVRYVKFQFHFLKALVFGNSWKAIPRVLIFIIIIIINLFINVPLCL